MADIVKAETEQLEVLPAEEVLCDDDGQAAKMNDEETASDKTQETTEMSVNMTNNAELGTAESHYNALLDIMQSCLGSSAFGFKHHLFRFLFLMFTFLFTD